jgi:hypothetical protein
MCSLKENVEDDGLIETTDGAIVKSHLETAMTSAATSYSEEEQLIEDWLHGFP